LWSFAVLINALDKSKGKRSLERKLIFSQKQFFSLRMKITYAVIEIIECGRDIKKRRALQEK